MDITESLAPKSDQLDAIELVSGPRIFTVTKVSAGSAEQPVNVHLAEFPRVWRPSKSMRRVLAACWGTDASQWAGRRVELYCDPAVQYGGKAVGGTRISRLSHIDAAKKVPLLVKRGQSEMFTVQPLPDTPAPVVVTAADVADCVTVEELRTLWHETADQTIRDQITARVAELQTVSEGDPK